ncbi:hypothetical protein [Salinigranum sp.]|uniref:hypothetical protein n=1 Tax=Salinigranum sp. TaxID=1966351 RepID=UPI00356955CC
MALSNRYRQLAALIDTLESHGISVQQAEPLDNGEDMDASDGGFAVQLRVELPADDTVDPFPVGRPESAERSVPSPESPARGPVGVNLAAADTETADGDVHPIVDGGATTHRDDASGRPDPDSHGTDRDEGADVDAAGGGTATDTAHETQATATAAAVTDTADDDQVEAAGEDTSVDDTAVPCTHPDCERTFDTERGMKIHRTKAHSLSELADTGGQTVHRDPEALARVYDEHETFAEMTEALDVDVGAQAVRKQMIRHGIHEPGSGDPNSDADADSVDERPDSDAADEGEGEGDAHAPDPSASAPRDCETDASLDTDDDTPVADRLPDLDLPGSLSTEELQAAVEEANTLYDVQRALELDQETARNVLTEYDLLELVSGRAAAFGDREALKAEIGQRIRRTAT